MITEDYVSFETAKLLEEKGFNKETSIMYGSDGTPENREEFIIPNRHLMFPCPTLQMAMKWLREVHNIQIQIAPINSRYKDWAFGIYKDFNPLTIELICCPTYEEACEAAIKYCLEYLI